VSTTNGSTTQARPIDVLLGRLERQGMEPQAAGSGQWRSRCPAHEGESRNLSIREEVDGTLLLNCFHRDAGGTPTCSSADIVAALGLQLSDLFPANGDRPRPVGQPREIRPQRERRERPARPSHAYRSPELAIAGTVRRLGPPTQHWVYQDADGHELMRVYRFDHDGKKEFRPVYPHADGWHLGDPPGLLPLYHLDELAAADIVIVTEGEKCADLGRGLGLTATTSAHGAGSPHKTDWSPVADKLVIVVPDHGDQGEGYATAVAALIAEQAPTAEVRIVRLPVTEDGEDIEEWLESLPESWDVDQCRQELERLWFETPRWTPPEPPDDDDLAAPSGFANFKVRIVREVVRHEAGTTTRHVDVEAVHDDGTVALATVKAEDFRAMGWVETDLGMKFVLASGRNVADRFQNAIRVNSFQRGVESKHVYTTLGWERVNGQDVYLHAGGAIGAGGKMDMGVDVSSELGIFRLPDPDPNLLAEAVARVLAIPGHLGPGAESIAAIVMSLPMRAVLGPSRTIPHFSGTTGTLKTSTCVVAVRFFAPSLEHSDSMPLSWSATAAGMERNRYVVGDMVLPIDNLIADGEQSHKDLWKADWVFNSQGDLTGKGRMRADGSTAPRLDPRSCVISTGEVEPRRRSAAGRSVIVEFRPGLIELANLVRCHDDARAGWYAQAMACYVKHLAYGGRLAAARARLRVLTAQYQTEVMAACQGCHPRHAEAIGEWIGAWELFVRFAVAEGALAQDAADACFVQAKAGLIGTLAAQASIQEEGDPGETFLELLKSLLATKRVVLRRTDGSRPGLEIAGACGWEERESQHGRIWEPRPGSTEIGWIDDRWVYLDPNAAHMAVERMARELGRMLGSQRQVQARLAETGRLGSVHEEKHRDGKRRKFSKHIQVEGSRPRCLWLPREEVLDESFNEAGSKS
jgi:hypothetical protein